ncbi:hypothetical protein ACRE_039570 [Hapsidospora chrysogenum ATCC 11550]|uniref:Zn(2)-C6 fungal-type domain-containing protein n=1 Tax=Hapsidospora chrysogenum (strain ATCC 11550 / CBS 779.69 / DSM 880 / IAM 14645 / JCM 23072 / IMI 49137) TaxID=857340 RepID=A0A086T7A7_HAPC1|nr:hypothetical protein ACRE_039570 [Hapsidospora chrysogenum ATCC 11550]
MLTSHPPFTPPPQPQRTVSSEMTRGGQDRVAGPGRDLDTQRPPEAGNIFIVLFSESTHAMTLTSKQQHHSSPSRAATATVPPRQPRLRASCDGCFLAKVKCSKARPVCSRCLAVGFVCRYSPSSRSPGGGSGAGAKKHQQHPQQQQSHLRPRRRRSVAAASNSTPLLASTMSEESSRWLAQGAAGAAGAAGGGGMMAGLDGGIGGCAAAAAAAAAALLGPVVVDDGAKGQHEWPGLGHMGEEGMPLQIAPSVLSTMPWADMVATPDATTTTSAWSWPSSSTSSSSGLAHQLSSTWTQPEYATLPTHPWQMPYWQITQDAYTSLNFESAMGGELRREGDASKRLVG